MLKAHALTHSRRPSATETRNGDLHAMHLCALVPLKKNCQLNGRCHEMVACVSNNPQTQATKRLRWQLAIVNCRGPPVTVSAMRH